MAQLITVRLSKSDHQPLGFRLQGGKDFGTPLAVQKVNGGSAAERAGLQAGDALIRVNNADVYTLRHQEAQDAIRLSGPTLELTVQRGGGTWKPSVTPTGSLPRPGSRLGASPATVTSTSLRSNAPPARAFGSGHNNVAKPYGYANGNDSKSIVNKQYNTPVNMYSDRTIAETLSAQTEVLAGGVLGVNFKKNEKTYDAEKSAVFKVLQEEQNDPEPEVCPGAAPPVSGLRHVAAPVARPDPPLNTGGLPVGQNICEECERLITGVFVRIKDKNLHVECFKCATCGASLKNQGYYNLNGKLYCDIHAKLVARQNTPAPNLEPVTVPPGGRIPSNVYSTPLPPLSTNNYSNGSSSMFSPSSAVSGPKPFGSSLGSAYSPSLSPRSAPLSPARPAVAPPPFAPTTEMQSSSTHLKTEFKSPAEERLIKKLAKMALNGYEIGIQRKIKPADHIQSMADRIQDTVVTKHPLNSESSLGDSSTDNNFIKSVIKSDRGYKTAESIQNIGDKIKDTILSKHPMATQFTQNNVPPPPPIPDSPIPSFNSHSTPISNSSTIKFNKSKYLDNNSKDNNAIQSSININGNTNGNLNKVDTFKTICSNTKNNNQGYEKAPYAPELNTLKTNQYDQKIKNNNSNTLKKQKLFDTINKYNGTENTNFVKQINDNDSNKNTPNIIKSSDENKISNEECVNNPNNNKLNLPDHLHDNTLYNVKYTNNNETYINNSFDSNKSKNNAEVDNELNDFKYPNINGTNKINGFDSKKTINYEMVNNEENEPDVVVKRRQKKTDRNSDGRRDSHIIARPMSTMTSADVADGLYPVCHVCDEAISRGPFITALGRIWCPDHFICVNATCRRPLQDIGFVEENGQLYCEYCFEQYIAPACNKCHAKIKGDCLNAIGKHFHPECFNCVYCGKLFGNNPFFLEDGLPYCEADWNELFTTKCFACGFPVEAGDRWVEALNNNYHSQCFNCTVCKKNLEGQSFFAKGGRPFCKMHAR